MRPTGAGGVYHRVVDVNTKTPESDSDRIWAATCLAEGWVCKLCGAVPECGKRFDDDLCDDCRLRLKNE